MREWVIIIIIIIIHYCFINGLEKMTLFYLFNSKNFIRPLPECNNLQNIPVKCLGMPSGHVEIAIILGYFLYSKKYISSLLFIFLVAFTCFQRIVTNRHTFLQTIIAILFGGFYIFIYSFTNYKIFASLFFIFLYCNILILKIHNLLSEKVPKWVDINMSKSIDKKINVPYYLKFISIFMCSFQQDRILFMNWKNLEFYLDKILDKIKKTGLHYDSVVGIKTGGAIISDYISNNLGIKNYKIKVSNKTYNCNKSTYDSIRNYINTYIYNNKPEYMVCEGITDNINGKNIILIDESVSSGVTMNTSIDYLMNKKVNNIYLTTIFSSLTNNVDKLNYIIKEDYFPMIWPWGYDN